MESLVVEQAKLLNRDEAKAGEAQVDRCEVNHEDNLSSCGVKGFYRLQQLFTG